jgi:hypothetical protein
VKKYIILALIFTALTSISFGQGMQLGLKAGVNFANVVGDDVEGAESKTGFAGGLFFMYQFNKLFAIQPEAYYTMKGATDEQTLAGETAEVTLSLDYIEIPILFKVLIPIENSPIRPSVFVGPYVGFNSTAKAKLEYMGQSVEDDIEDIKSTEFGLVFGAGLGFPVGQNELGVDFRYELGLTTLDDSAENADIKNSVFNINAYFGFNLH